MTSRKRRGRGRRANARGGQAALLRDQVDRAVTSGFPRSEPDSLLVFMCVLDFLSSVLGIVSQVGQVNFKHPVCYTAKAILEFLTLMPPHPECWDYKRTPPPPPHHMYRVWKGNLILLHARQALCI